VRSAPSCGAYQRLYSPGSSLNDKDVIAAADEAGIAMVFSGVR
jgi:phosphoribosylaminoimidazolecarboxamide formyltransferase/IMP cyclohydrolase